MKALVIPEGCAHGFQSLEDDIEMIYMSTTFYCKEAEDAIRYNDPKVNIQWPLEVTILSEKDATHKFIFDKFTGVII
jgi:dTDP-4-dehydrorhamnose 3,5-epimerase